MTETERDEADEQDWRAPDPSASIVGCDCSPHAATHTIDAHDGEDEWRA